jgi:hypothetical protein
MKMTFELPDDLARQLRMKAAADGIKLKDLITEACARFLHQAPKKRAKPRKPQPSPFPIIPSNKKLRGKVDLSPERVFELLYGDEHGQ